MTTFRLPTYNEKIQLPSGYTSRDWYSFFANVFQRLGGVEDGTEAAEAISELTTVGTIQRVGTNLYSTYTVTTFAKSFLDDADAVSVRTTLGAAPLDAPAFTGVPTADTAAPGTNTTQLATTAFVVAAIGTPVVTVNGQAGAVILANVVTETGTARNLAQSDRDKYIRFTNAGAKTYTIQNNATTAITQDTMVSGRNAGAGDLTLVKDSSVTINPPAGGTLVIPEGGTFSLLRVAEDVWDLFGVTVAA